MRTPGPAMAWASCWRSVCAVSPPIAPERGCQRHDDNRPRCEAPVDAWPRGSSSLRSSVAGFGTSRFRIGKAEWYFEDALAVRACFEHIDDAQHHSIAVPVRCGFEDHHPGGYTGECHPGLTGPGQFMATTASRSWPGEAATCTAYRDGSTGLGHARPVAGTITSSVAASKRLKTWSSSFWDVLG